MTSRIKNKSSLDKSLSLLKCILVIGVILFHCGFERNSPNEKDVLLFLKNLFSFVVIGFFWSAGYLMKKNEGILQTVQKRALRLLLPFFVVSFINWIAFLYLEELTKKEFGYALSISDFLKKTITLQGVGPQMYFLPYLFIIQLLGTFIERALINDQLLLLPSLVLFGSWMFLSQNHNLLGPEKEKISLYLASLLLGMSCREWPVQKIFPLACLVGPFVIASCAFFKANAIHSVCSFICPLVLYFLLRGLRVGVQWKEINKDIFSVFIWHTPLILPFYSLIFMGPLRIVENALLLTVVASIITSVLAGRILSRTTFKSVLGKS